MIFFILNTFYNPNEILNRQLSFDLLRINTALGAFGHDFFSKVYGLIPWISCENIWATGYNERKMSLPGVITMNFVFRYHCMKTKRTKKKVYSKMNNLEIFTALRTSIKINV